MLGRKLKEYEGDLNDQLIMDCENQRTQSVCGKRKTQLG
jgi:hypothetical protein